MANVMTTAPLPAKTPDKKLPEPKDSLRDITETVVFVIVLVLMLKLFVAEAFVIPTGSMAETLWGHQKIAVCDECEFEFPVNAYDEVEGPGRQGIVGYHCPNCGNASSWNRENNPTAGSGDRVLVLKPEYHFSSPNRWEVPVFKYPKEPMQNWIATNYIKRLIGLPGETIALYSGDLYVVNWDYPQFDDKGQEIRTRPDKDTDLWRHEYMYSEQRDRIGPDGKDLFREHSFRILRKPPVKMMAMSRIVNDNDFQPKTVAGKLPRNRWAPENPVAWTFDDPKMPKQFTATSPDNLSWLRYQNIQINWLEPEKSQPALITNFLGYNAGEHREPNRNNEFRITGDGEYWVGDLIVEAEVEAQSDDGEIVLELSRSVDRFQARFNLADGKCTLVRNNLEGRKELASQSTTVKGKGTYKLRFANVDQQLTVWVGSKVIDFGKDSEYAPPPVRLTFDTADHRQEGWFRENDLLAPASIGIQGKGVVKKIRLLRDTFYTSPAGRVETFYVQPGHYFCLGDNSAASADSRSWGVVPERLLLGRALVVYYPLSRIGLIE